MTLLAHSVTDVAEFKAMAAQTGNAVLPATTAVAGSVKKALTVANCTVATDGTSAGTQLNLLLASLRTAGIIV